MRNLKTWVWVTVAVVSFTLLFTSLRKQPASSAAPNPCPGGYVALTFDDGPDPVTTPKALTYLKQHGLHATFFVLGMKVRQHPDLYRQIISEGHTVAVHTWDHQSLTGKSTKKTGLTFPQIEQEIRSTVDTMVEVGGVEPVFWRPPYGDTNPQIAKFVKDKFGLTEVGWTVSSRDTFKIPVDEIFVNTMKLVDGGTVLSHDTVPNSVEAIPYIASGLKDKGLCTGKLAVSQFPVEGWYAGEYFARPVAP